MALKRIANLLLYLQKHKARKKSGILKAVYNESEKHAASRDRREKAR